MSTTNGKEKTPEQLLAARKAIEAAEKAELKQALMSLYIPLSLFISCCIFAAGVFMVYYEEPAGWFFIGATLLIALSAFIALFKFQNKFRARGIIPTKDTIVESNVIDASPEAKSVSAASTPAASASGGDTTGDAVSDNVSAPVQAAKTATAASK